MKFGFRMPSLKKRIAARTSFKRVIRHSMGIKAPRGMGFLTNPKKALYNKVYNKTTFGLGSAFKYKSSNKIPSVNSSATSKPTPSKKGSLKSLGIVVLIIFLISLKLAAIPIVLIGAICYYVWWKSPEQQAKRNVTAAQVLVQQQVYEEAIRLLQEAIQLDKNNKEAPSLLGLTYSGAEKYEEALPYLQNFLTQNPTDYQRWIVLANCLYKAKKLNEAIEILQKFPPEFEGDLRVIQLLGACFAALKKYDLAIEVFKKAPLKKRNLDENLLELHYNLALIYEESGDKKNALKHFKKVYADNINYRDVAKKVEVLEKF